MVDEFNKGVQNHGALPLSLIRKSIHRRPGISTEQMSAVRVELKGEDTELDGIKFDVVMVRFSNLGSKTQMYNCFPVLSGLSSH